MMGLCKRLTLILVLVVAGSYPAFAQLADGAVTPTTGTANSLYILTVAWSDPFTSPNTEPWTTAESGGLALGSPWTPNPSYHAVQPDPADTIIEQCHGVDAIENEYVELQPDRSLVLSQAAVGIKAIWADRWDRQNLWLGGAFSGSTIPAGRYRRPVGAHVFVSYYVPGRSKLVVTNAPLPTEYTVYAYPVEIFWDRISINPEILNLDPDTQGTRTLGNPLNNLLAIYDNPQLQGMDYYWAIDPSSYVVYLAGFVPNGVRYMYVVVSSYAIDRVWSGGMDVPYDSYDPDFGEITLSSPLATVGQSVNVMYRPLGNSRITVGQVPIVAVSGVYLDSGGGTSYIDPALVQFDAMSGRILLDTPLPAGTRSVYLEYAAVDMEGVTTQETWNWQEGGHSYPIVRESDDQDQRYAMLPPDPADTRDRESSLGHLYHGVRAILDEPVDRVDLAAGQTANQVRDALVAGRPTTSGFILAQAADATADPPIPETPIYIVTQYYCFRVMHIYRAGSAVDLAPLATVDTANGVITLNMTNQELGDSVTQLIVSYYGPGTSWVLVEGPLPMPSTVYPVPLVRQPPSDLLRVNADILEMDPDPERWRGRAIATDPGYNILGIFDNYLLTGWNYYTPGPGNVTYDASDSAVIQLNVTPSSDVIVLYVKVSTYAVDGVWTQETGGLNYYPGRVIGSPADDPEYAYYEPSSPLPIGMPADPDLATEYLGILHLARPLPTPGMPVYVTYRNLSSSCFTPARGPVMSVRLCLVNGVEVKDALISFPGTFNLCLPGGDPTDAQSTFPPGTRSIDSVVYHAGVCTMGTYTDAIYASGVGRLAYTPMYPDDVSPAGWVFVTAGSIGLNLSRAEQQPQYDPNDWDNPLVFLVRYDGVVFALDYFPAFDPLAFQPILFGYVAATVPPTTLKVGTDPLIVTLSPISVTVYGSSPWYGTFNTVDYGGGGNGDFLTSYPGFSFPSAFDGPDPLIPVPPSPVVPAAIYPDDGASSTTFDFRVRYWNDYGLAPSPWLPSWADELDPVSGRIIAPTGVVLYLDLMDVFDLGEEHRQEGYRPHFMRLEDPTQTTYAAGVDYLYRLQPCETWMQSGLIFFPPTPFLGNDYMSLMTGSYHYFFGCSDDIIPPGILGARWGQRSPFVRHETRSSTGLDPSVERQVFDVDGRPWMPRPQGRRYSSFGDEFIDPKDWQIYVDRIDRVPGRFEQLYDFQYPWPATQHPEVTIALSGLDKSDLSGFARFFNTLKPFYRAVNPLITTPWSLGGFGYVANRLETSGATTATTLTFRIKYYQRDNQPPVSMKVYIGNDTYKVINPNQPYAPENGGFVGHTMQPAAVQTSAGQSQTPPYDYRLGVDYEFKSQLPAGPHGYFFMANDGKAIAEFPARPDDWLYNGITYGDWWVPGYRTGSSDPAGYDNNYIPGPYINHACELSSPSVTPVTGMQGQDFVYRVLYKDPDGQRPYQAGIYIDTGNPSVGTDGIVKGSMVKEDPGANDYISGVWYVLDTATLEEFSLAKGTRRYRFEFIDDWGRQTDPNDTVRGETTKLPASGGWIEGPTIGGRVPPTLTKGYVLSTDGTANGATIWKFSVIYKDLSSEAPKFVTVYIGELLPDGHTIKWDYGNPMSKANPADEGYLNGVEYFYLTRLRGAQNASDYSRTFYYAFEASNGIDLATWVPITHPDKNAWSESAGCLLKEELTTNDHRTYRTSKRGGASDPATDNPIVGTLFNQPVDAGILIDPIVWKYPAGDMTNPEIVSRDDIYQAKGMYWLPRVVYRYEPEDPAYLPAISEVLGVFLYQDLSGTNYYIADNGTTGSYDPASGVIALARDLPFGTDWVWIQYRHIGEYTLNRWTGEFTFAAAQDPTDLLKADYFFATRLATQIGVNQLPTLSNPKLAPMVGASTADFIYTVDYKETEGPNGQPPDFVRVVIDGVEHDMVPIVQGTPLYRSGVTFRYSAKLHGGSHIYYFTTSDGVGLVTLPASDPVTGKIVPYLGPWVNDPPWLSSGAADPNPQTGTISTAQPVLYSVVFGDPDNDAPIAGTPILYVDNATEASNGGSVAEIIEDPAEAGKHRLIRVESPYGQTLPYTADQFAGKLLQFTSGALSGRVYLIANNGRDTLRLMADDLISDGLDVGQTFSIAAVQMFKADPLQQNYAGGITYSLIVPQLAEGLHKFHFKAASVMTPPSWVGPPYNAMTRSDWVRFPAIGEITGPNVAVKPPDTNHPPLLTEPVGDTPVSPSSGKTTDSFDFYVTYRDDDADPPRYHDGVLGYVRVLFNDGSYAADMHSVIPEDPTNPAFFATARRCTVRANGLPEGNHKFHFEASDGWVKIRWPDLVQGPDPTANDPQVAVNVKAKLTDMLVSPPSGNTSTTFDISVKYTDPNGLGPIVTGGKEQVWVEITASQPPGATTTTVYLTRNVSDTNFAGGVNYRGKVSQLATGTYLTVFKALDNAGELTQVSGPDIRVAENLNPPKLENPKVYNLARPSEINAAATGGTADTFRYEVKYSDADGDIPVVELSGSIVEGIQLYVDGKLEATVGQTQRIGDDFVAGVTYRYDKAGRTYTAGDHDYQFSAKDGVASGAHTAQTALTDGPTIIAATITLVREAFNTANQAWETRDPKIRETMRISGVLTGSPAKPIPGGQKITITIARPDGTGETFVVTCTSENRFSFERVPMINKTWTITARWEGNANYKPAVVQDIKVEVKGPTRAIATANMDDPRSAPVIDMVCMPLVAPSRDAGQLFGYDRANLLQLVRWDPVQRVYLRYGQTYFPPIEAASAVWIYPSALHPWETLDPLNLPWPVDLSHPINASLQYRLLKPFGTLLDPTAGCAVAIRGGWNQFGSPYLNSTQLSSAQVIYQGQTVSLEQASSNGWIRNYAWMWDPVLQDYRLIHPTRPDAYSRTIDPWRGYWIRSFVDCSLILAAPSSQAVAAASVAEEAGPMATRSLPALDQPPTPPGGAAP